MDVIDIIKQFMLIIIGYLAGFLLQKLKIFLSLNMVTSIDVENVRRIMIDYYSDC
jgi:hypothetical protein